MSGKISGGGGIFINTAPITPGVFCCAQNRGKFPARHWHFAGAKKLLVPFCYQNKFKYKELFITGKPFLFDVVEFSNNSPCFFRRVYNFARLRFFRRNNPVRGQARDVYYRIPKFFAYQHYRNILFFTRFYQG